MSSRDNIKNDPVVLLGEQLGEGENQEINHLNIDVIKHNPDQARKHFDQDSLEELSESIKQYGVLQPIIVQPKGEYFLIIAGERRWRACKMVGVKEIPVIIKNPHCPKDFTAISLIENLQRKNLKVTEEAQYYQKFLECNSTQEELAKMIGKSRSYVANLVRINSLSSTVKEKIDQGLVSLGHAKVLVGIKEAENIVNIIIEKKLNVRATEELIRKLKDTPKKQVKKYNTQDENILQDIKNITTMLENTFQAKVNIQITNDKGKITISFESLKVLDTILQKVNTINTN